MTITPAPRLSAREQAKAAWAAAKAAWKGDGCTASPDLTFRECCDEHDYLYQTRLVSRKEADLYLRECMRAKGYLILPWVYYLAVRLFGRRAPASRL